MVGDPASPDDHIQPDEIKKVLQESGYLLEARVAQVLEDHHFYVERNIFVPDPRDESASIEIDVVGKFGELVDEESRSNVVAELLIECKNNSQPVAFFLKTQPVTEINDNWIKYGGFPSSSADPETHVHVPLHRLIGMKDSHHYCQAREVATQFCSFSRPEERHGTSREQWRWKAEPMQNYSKSFSDLCVVADAAPFPDDFALDHRNIQLEFRYPVIVFQGPIYELRVSGTELDIKAADHLQLHHSASVHGQVARAQIDVVSEKAFPSLIELILKELTRIAASVRDHFDRLLKSAIDQKELAARNRARSEFGVVVRGLG